MQNHYAHILFRKFDFLAFVLLLNVTSPCLAMDVTLEWDANTEIDRAGYRIYYDTDAGPLYEGIGAEEGGSPIDVKIADVEVGVEKTTQN